MPRHASPSESASSPSPTDPRTVGRDKGRSLSQAVVFNGAHAGAGVHRQPLIDAFDPLRPLRGHFPRCAGAENAEAMALRTRLGTRASDPASARTALVPALDPEAERGDLVGAAAAEVDIGGVAHEGGLRLLQRPAERPAVDGQHLAVLYHLPAVHEDAPADYPLVGAGDAAAFGTDPDGLKLEVVHLPG